uniref:Uncharacterized protein n=1 Tax=Anguilla anguilla TaxID=7936 RepID=A0A0E9SZ10_ANGAN
MENSQIQLVQEKEANRVPSCLFKFYMHRLI